MIKSYDKFFDEKRETAQDEQEAKPEVKEKPAKKVEVCNCGRLYVREKPSRSSEHVDILVVGDVVEVKKMFADWVRVVTPSGVVGYVAREFTKEA